MKIICILLLILITSCASKKHRFMSGSVSLKIDERAGIACFEPGTVKVGERLKFMNSDCSRPIFPDVRGSCKLSEAGEIRITRIINPHYAEFVKISGPEFKEGTIIGTP